MPDIKVSTDVSALKAGLREVRDEANHTQAAIESLGEAITSLPGLNVSIPGARQSAAAQPGPRLGNTSASTPGGYAQDARDAERLHRLRKSHALLESQFRQRLSERMARRDERSFQNAARVFPHLRQFDSLAAYQARDKAAPVSPPTRESASIFSSQGDKMKTLGRIAGVTGGMAGGMITGNGGTFGMLGGLAGGAAGLLGGPLGMIAGNVLGPVLGALGAKVDEAIRDSIEEGTQSANLARAFGTSVTDFKKVQDASRDAADGMRVSYAESARHASMYARVAGLKDPSGLREGLQGGYGFGVALGVGQGSGVSFMAAMRGSGAAGDEKAARRIGLSVAEAIQKGGLGPQADEVLQAIQNFTSISTQANFRAPDVGSFASIMAAGSKLDLPGLHASGMASILQGVDSSIRQGGSYGAASETLSLNAIANLDPGLDVFASRRVMQGGAFGTIAAAYGENSAAVKEADARRMDAEARGDDTAAAQARADLAKYRRYAAGPNAGITNLDAQMRMFQGMGGDEAARTMGNHFGLSMDQASVLRATYGKAGSGSDLLKMLQDKGIDVSNVNMGGAMHMASVVNGGHDVLEQTRKRLLEGKDFNPLTEKQKNELNNAKGDDQLRDVLLNTLGKVGGAQSSSDKALQAQLDMKNSLARIAERLIPIAEKTSEGINALVEKLAPQSEYVKRVALERTREERTQSMVKQAADAGVTAEPDVLHDYRDKIIAARQSGNHEEVVRLMKEREAYMRTGVAPATPAEQAEAAAAIAPTIPGAAEAYKRAGASVVPSPSIPGVSRLLEQIAKGEGTSDAQAKAQGFASGYDVPLGYGKFGMPDKPLTSMTIGEVKKYQAKLLQGSGSLNSSAVGKYQIVGKTLRGLQSQMGFGDDELFSPELQDKMAVQLLKGRGLDRYMGGGLSGKGFQSNLVPEWASIADPYTGRALQHTGTTTPEFQAALPEPASASRPASGGGKLEISGEFTLKDVKGRTLDTIKVGADHTKYRPWSAGVPSTEGNW